MGPDFWYKNVIGVGGKQAEGIVSADLLLICE